MTQAEVRPSSEKTAVDDFAYLSEGAHLLLLRELPTASTEKALRNRGLLGLLALQGLRTAEIERADVGDLQRRGEGRVLLVRGKGRDWLVYLRPNVATALDACLGARDRLPADDQGEALPTAMGNFAGGPRLMSPRPAQGRARLPARHPAQARVCLRPRGAARSAS